MAKSRNSWSKPDNCPGLIARKKVDWSIFDYGSHIPKLFHDDFNYANGGTKLEVGKNYKVKLTVDNCEYDALLKFRNRNYDNDKGGYTENRLEINYAANDEFIGILKSKLETTYKYFIEKNKGDKRLKNNKIPIDDDTAAYLYFYKTDKPFYYRVEAIDNLKNDSINDMAAAVISEKSEDAVKASQDHDDIYLNILNSKYSLEDCSAQTGIEIAVLNRWINALNRKGQAIIYGPPGTGKTFIAERLAEHLISDGYGFSDTIQFHPSYSYEDFVEGIRPSYNEECGVLEYPVLPGRFKIFCNAAGKRKDTCVLIIDEINRANISRVFGELMYLLEYREKEIRLANGELFKIPSNVRIIGTMNTADRSIAFVDHALRRRYAFIALRPDYRILKEKIEDKSFPIDELINILVKINNRIADRNYEIGISFFLKNDIRNNIEDIWLMEIEPYLEEFFIGNSDAIDEFRWDKVMRQLGL